MEQAENFEFDFSSTKKKIVKCRDTFPLNLRNLRRPPISTTGYVQMLMTSPFVLLLV